MTILKHLKYSVFSFPKLTLCSIIKIIKNIVGNGMEVFLVKDKLLKKFIIFAKINKLKFIKRNISTYLAFKTFNSIQGIYCLEKKYLKNK